jgi:hypothetical protein
MFIVTMHTIDRIFHCSERAGHAAATVCWTAATVSALLAFGADLFR